MDAYRARGRVRGAAWRSKNPEALRRACQKSNAKRATDPTRRLYDIKRSAKKRGISFAEGEAEVHLMRCKLLLPCRYCGVPGIGTKQLNGLDRIDWKEGYSDGNTQPCCPTCNNMKGCLPEDEFLHAVHSVATYRRLGAEVLTTASSPLLPLVWRRPQGALSKKKKDLLTPEQKVNLWAASCFLCGRCPAVGIDRFDSKGVYSPDNVNPCCTTCNIMKQTWSLKEFLAQMAHIYAHTWTKPLNDVGDVPLTMLGKCARVPVRVTVEGESMIFPSASTLDRLTGVGQDGWDEVPIREYREQQVEPEVAHRIISRLISGY
ncbi:hypothetical protein V8C86DRAFT_2984016 [Haematococcus lacustris]